MNRLKTDHALYHFALYPPLFNDYHVQQLTTLNQESYYRKKRPHAVFTIFKVYRNWKPFSLFYFKGTLRTRRLGVGLALVFVRKKNEASPPTSQSSDRIAVLLFLFTGVSRKPENLYKRELSPLRASISPHAAIFLVTFRGLSSRTPDRSFEQSLLLCVLKSRIEY